MYFSKISVVAALATSATAYTANKRSFAVNHFYGKGPLVEGRMDPIINPGVASGHVHTVQGGNKFSLTMSDTDAMESTCTSSLVKNDKSNYWTPSLYFKDPATGALEKVELFYMNVYYFFEATTDKIKAFPVGQRMVVGNAAARTPPATGGNLILDKSQGTPQAVQWTCPRSNTNQPLYPANSDGLHGVGIGDTNNKGAGVGFSDKNCDGYASPLRADIHFPSCYNPAAGVGNYKENSDWPTNGNCPEGWVHTPHLFYEVYWNTPKFASRWTPGQGKQPFVLSNGDPTGYGLHADFISGWDVPTLQQIIDNCDAGDSGMDKCPGLIGGLNDDRTTCNIPSAIQETISGTLTALPGNNPIGEWGVAAPGGAPAPGSMAPAPSSAAPKPSSSASKPAPTSAAGPVVPVVSTKQAAISTQEPVPTVIAPSSGSPDTYVTTTIIMGTTTIDSSNSAAPAKPTSPPSTPSTPSTGGNAVGNGFTYKGCYKDGVNADRVLAQLQFADIGQKKVSNTKCVAYCASKGYSLAGTEFGGQCFCSDTLAKENKLEESACNVPCEGDSQETCGGSLALSVYSSSAASKIKRSVRARHLARHLSH
ncbi:hypothetical protein HYALB_00001816 [Hymenoscyphus albidus]|uniref:WSC domain-containing protein n=1 Tax=Hymenoscyphus albidus TaxID=595503 RepID=A0A9N9LSR1_9HELO|nr:hypothetical protein HYALB_00001816 [Hymenoscyphus albidus]